VVTVYTRAGAVQTGFYTGGGNHNPLQGEAPCRTGARQPPIQELKPRL